MGVNNRQRRRQKQAKRYTKRRAGQGRTAGPGYGRWTGSEGELRGTAPADLVVGALIDQAAEDLFHEPRGKPSMAFTRLVQGTPPIGSRRMVARILRERLEDDSSALAAHRWLPSEVSRVVRRRLGRTHEMASTASIRSGWRRLGPQLDPEWSAEAAAIGCEWSLDPAAGSWVSDVDVAVRVLGLVRHLPTLPPRTCADGSGSSGEGQPRDERVLAKVRHLLSKAESTTYAEEADALTAKAQELLTRYSLDRAAAEATSSSERAASSVHRVWIDDPYVVPKAQLLYVVALANRCRSVVMETVGLATVVGHEDDIETVELLFTSLLVQATAQLTVAGPKTDPFGRSRTRSFRQSFLVAFAIRIGHRLREADELSVSEATHEHGQTLLPVLASRDGAAQEAVADLFPDLTRRESAATDHEGWIAGMVAADQAALFVHRELADEVV